MLGRLIYLGLIGMGLFAIVAREKFVRSSLTTSRNVFGRDIRPGSREHTFMTWYTRILAVVCGTGMVVLGILGTLGVIQRD